jgi:hypothetical protein
MDPNSYFEGIQKFELKNKIPQSPEEVYELENSEPKNAGS